MTLITKKPTATMPRFFDSFLLKDMLELPEFSANRSQGVPAVNIKETNKNFVLEMAVPGMRKEDFSIEVEKEILTISSQEKEEKEGKEEVKEEKYHLREFNTPSFKRSFRLPENLIDTEKIEASYTNGVLTLTLPKKEEVKIQPKQIKIS